MPLVIDASALVAALLEQEAAGRVRAAMSAAEGTLVAPELLDVEVMSAVRRDTLAGRLSQDRGQEAIDDLRRAAIIRQQHTPLIPRVWGLRHNLSAYDAMYVALAEALDAPLLTLDASLARAPGHMAQVEVV